MSDLSGVPALILTAGLATRLRPLSDIRAKAAMPVAGAPVIERVLRWLRAAGIRRVVLNLHHRPETITSIVGDGSQWDLAVRYSWERRVLGSAGGPRHALSLLDGERFVIVNGDTLTDCDLQALARHHHARGALVTMAVVPGDVNRYGGVLVGDESVVSGFGRSAPNARPLHFIGVQLAERVVFAPLADEEPSETVRSVYPALLTRSPGSISAFVSGAEFLDIGTPADYHATVAAVSHREGVGFDTGTDCRIDATAEVRNSVLWDRVVVSPGVRLDRCVVADDVRLPEGASYTACAIAATDAGLVVRPF